MIEYAVELIEILNIRNNVAMKRGKDKMKLLNNIYEENINMEAKNNIINNGERSTSTCCRFTK